jgi:aspartate dehydrogenase
MRSLPFSDASPNNSWGWGAGPDRTRIEIWADPSVTRNTHTIEAVSDSSNLTVTIENIPSVENPATGKITALSALAALRRLTAPLVVGT